MGVISTHAPREGSDLPLLLFGHTLYMISTHAPREGSDFGAALFHVDTLISTHAPREGSDGV